MRESGGPNRSLLNRFINNASTLCTALLQPPYLNTSGLRSPVSLVPLVRRFASVCLPPNSSLERCFFLLPQPLLGISIE